ncbi:hypothetical protein Trydic_g3590 [Trypoxylus dichotomus]
MCVWWAGTRITQYEFLERAQTINTNFNEDKQESRKVVFLQDNARPHTERLTREKNSELDWETLPLPLYSPDITPSDYFCLFATVYIP